MSDDPQHDFEGSEHPRVTHRGPANWFTFSINRQTAVNQDSMMTEVRLAGLSSQQSSHSEQTPPSAADSAAAVLTFHSHWLDETSQSIEQTLLEPALLFPRVIFEAPRQTLPSHRSGFSCSGISRAVSDGPWWKRWLEPRQSYQWRLWQIRQGNILIIGSAQSFPGQPFSEQVIHEMDQIVESIRISQHPAWPPELFRTKAVELAQRKFPLLRIEAGSGFAIKVQDSQIQLANFYRTYLRSTEQFEQIVLPGITALVRLQELGPEQLVPQLNDVRHKILPMLSPEGETQGHELAEVPWVGGLSVRFVLDEDDSYRFIPEELLKRWDLSEDELHSLALENLSRYTAEHPLEVSVVGDEDDPRILMPTKPDVYNCSRILDQRMHSRLRELFGSELLVGLPNRDFFVAISLRHQKLIQEVRDRVSEDFSTLHHPLTERLLVISADGVSEYCGPNESSRDDHPGTA